MAKSFRFERDDEDDFRSRKAKRRDSQLDDANIRRKLKTAELENSINHLIRNENQPSKV